MSTDAADHIEVFDFVPAHTLNDGDNVLITNTEEGEDYLENITMWEETDTVCVKGYSIIRGDKVTYFLPEELEVGLWQV